MGWFYLNRPFCSSNRCSAVALLLVRLSATFAIEYWKWNLNCGIEIITLILNETIEYLEWYNKKKKVTSSNLFTTLLIFLTWGENKAVNNVDSDPLCFRTSFRGPLQILAWVRPHRGFLNWLLLKYVPLGYFAPAVSCTVIKHTGNGKCSYEFIMKGTFYSSFGKFTTS